MIFLTGHHATGKTQAATEFIAAGYPMVDLGPTIRSLHAQSGSTLSFADWARRGEETHGRDFTNNQLVRAINPILQRAANVGREAVIVGSRSPEGLCYIRDHVEDPAGRAAVLYIWATIAQLHERWMAREGRSVTRHEFLRMLKHDRDMGVERIRLIADHVVCNRGDLETFMSRIRRLCLDLESTCSFSTASAVRLP